MKKIVALVLSLVMALSLCTVAFAYDTGDKLYDGKTNDATTTNTYEYHAASTNYKVGDKANNVAFLKVIAGPDTGKFYYVVEKDGKVLYENASTVASIQRGDEFTSNPNGETYNVKAEEVKAEAWSCTTDKHDAGYKYVGSDDKTYYAVKADANEAGSFNALVDGKIVRIKDQKDFIRGQHILTVPTAGAKELDVGVYEAYCAACHKTLKYSKDNINGAGALYTVDTNTVQWLADNHKTVAIPTGYQTISGVYIVGEADTKADDTKKDGVDSAKTFDAGVAMYVGMSLLSVAGGAVVIGKKKEF